MQRSVRCVLLTAVVLAPAGAFGSQIQPVGWKKYFTNEGCNQCQHAGNTGSGFHCDSCQSGAYCDAGGRCSMRSTRNDFATNWSGNCGPTGRLANRGCRIAQRARWCSTTKAFPDAGWAPPTRMPVNRTGTGFQSYISSGGPYAGAPMVYQATDTTQLGYSYAHVPTWRRNSGMIPPTPIPSNFHGRFCPHGSGCGPVHGGGCRMGGGFVHEQAIAPACQTCNPGYSSMMDFKGAVQPAHVAMTTQTTYREPETSLQANVLKSAPQLQTGTQIEVVAHDTTSKRSQPAGTSGPMGRSQSQSSEQQQNQKSGRGWFGLPSLREISF